MLDSAKTKITDWWATKEKWVRSRGGYKVRQGLVYQMQREAVTQAHKAAAEEKLGDDDTYKLLAFAIETAKVPEW